MDIFDLDPDYQPGLWGRHFDNLKRLGTVTLETRHRAKDGRVFPVEVNANYVFINGQEFNFAFLRDITVRKRIEQKQYQLSADLQRSNQELEQFAYVASHDLQEPLRAVAGCVQILRNRYQDKLDARADELIRHSVEGAERMQTLIADLLAFSSVGTQGTKPVPLESGAALGSALVNLRTALTESGATVTHDPLPSVVGDRMQLTQLFQNLVGNALKYRSPARPPAIHVSAEPEGEHWRFAVQDNGIGIEPQYFERIFVIFQRLHTRAEYPGTGIGLALCKKIVERHGGRLWLESQPGEGTVFYFTLSAPA
jgi:light-regulated signal transduction histidine kinase (bacteriophytochrome)